MVTCLQKFKKISLEMGIKFALMCHILLIYSRFQAIQVLFKIDDVTNCASENIGVMIFKLGTSNVHQIKHKVTPIAMATVSSPVSLCNELNISDFEQTRRSMSVNWVACGTCYTKTEGTELGGIDVDRFWGHPHVMPAMALWLTRSYVELFCNVVSRFEVFYFLKLW